MYNKKLICITGADGCGKSTLINQLLNHYPNSKKIGIWDAFSTHRNSFFVNKAAIDTYLCELSCEARSLFLAHALQESMKNNVAMTEDFIFLDAYYYKYFCSEIALGTSHEMIQMLANFFIKPDLVISINLEPIVCANRKTKFTRYECGLAATPSIESFIDFQEKCRKNWNHFKDENWINLNGNFTKEMIFETTINKIDSLCKSI